MAKKETPTVVAIPTSKAQVPSAIESLKVQLALLKGEDADNLSLDIAYNGQSIKNVDTVSELLAISASLHVREKAFNAEIIRYNLQNSNIQPFNESDKTVDHWEKVIEKAINTLINGKKITQLENAIKGLSKHLDEETKLQNELKELMESASSYIQ